MSLKDRTIQAMELAKFSSNADLAKAVSRNLGRHVPAQSIQSITSGRLKTSRHTDAIADVCGVDRNWLRTGEGHMRGGVGESKGVYAAGEWPKAVSRKTYKRIEAAAKELAQALAMLEPDSEERMIVEREISKQLNKKSKK